MNPISIETATGYLKAGLSCLPAARAKKHPSIGSWKTWAGRLPTEIEVEAWFANSQDGICVVAGAVSGNLECMDFDNHGELFEAWMQNVDTALLAKLVIEQSPSGGYHVLYRSTSQVEGNLKLARGVRDGRLTTLIETRGEGGLFLCCPTDGYVLQQGEFAHIPTIEPIEREALLNAARSLDECPAAVAPPAPSGANVGQPGGFLARPGDDFAERGDIRPYLTAAGWQFLGNHPDGNELWRRPGKSSGGHSATFDGHVFYVFSSNAAPFESERGYNLFQVYTLLEHRGDFTAAAAAVLDKGYGKRDESAPSVDFTAFNALLANGGVSPGRGAGSVQTQPSAPVGPRFLTIGQLIAGFPKLRPVLIHGFLRLGETMNIIAPPKTGKSWLVTDLALSVATGTEWFGFPCEQGRVLIIDNELHKETSADRIPKIVKARGQEMARVSDLICVENQRGCLKTVEDIGNHVEEYREAGFKLIIIDAFYRAMPRGVDENDNGAIADVYNLLDRFAEQIGCAFVLIHHTSKGNQSRKSVTDVGSGAGSQSRAADTHVILRRHKEQGVVVMESVVRSFPTVQPLCLRWNWPLWNADASLNPDDLEGKQESRLPKRGTEAAVETENWVERVPSLVRPGEHETKTLFVSRIEKLANVSRAKARLIFDSAIDLGYIRCEKPAVADGSPPAAKYVVLGDVRPQSDTPQTEDSDDDE